MSELVFNGQILEDGEYGSIYIGENAVSDIAKEIDEEMVSLVYYISNEPIDENTVVEKFLRTFYEGVADVNNSYMCGSSWTGVYGKNDSFEVGGHNIIDELSSHLGEFCLLKIKTA